MASTDQKQATPEVATSEPTQKPCTNCKRQIPLEKYDLHESYCHRFNILCEKCGCVYDKRSQANHPESHKPVSCSICSQQFESGAIDAHKSACKKKKKMNMLYCEFCEHEVHLKQYEQHIETCGSRTDNCTICNKPIKKSEMETHLSLCIKEDSVELAQKALKRKAPTLIDILEDKSSQSRSNAPKKGKSTLDKYISSKGGFKPIEKAEDKKTNNKPAAKNKKVVQVDSDSEDDSYHDSDFEFIVDDDEEDGSYVEVSSRSQNVRPVRNNTRRQKQDNKNKNTKKQKDIEQVPAQRIKTRNPPRNNKKTYKQQLQEANFQLGDDDDQDEELNAIIQRSLKQY